MVALSSPRHNLDQSTAPLGAAMMTLSYAELSHAAREVKLQAYFYVAIIERMRASATLRGCKSFAQVCHSTVG